MYLKCLYLKKLSLVLYSLHWYTQHCGKAHVQTQYERANFERMTSVIFVTKIKTRTRIIGRRFQITKTRIIIVIQKTKTK